MTRERARIERRVHPFTKDARFFVADEPCITAAKAVTLIHRELAKERGKVRRIVINQPRWKAQVSSNCMPYMTTELDGEYLDRVRLLAALRKETR
jgi:hypothetical protein